MATIFRALVTGLYAVLTCGFAQSQSNTDFHIVFNSDTMFIGAKVHDTKLSGGRYIAAEERKFHYFKGEEPRVSSILQYAIDCKSPRKIALVLSSFNLETKPNFEPRWGYRYEKDEYERGFDFDAIDYLSLPDFNESRAKIIQETTGLRRSVIWPHSPNLVVEYACAVAGTTTSAKAIAAELVKTGGIPTLKELACDITFRSGTNRAATVSFDDDLSFVKLDNRWKLNPLVNAQTIGYVDEDGVAMRINRKNGRLSLSSKEGVSLASGVCDIARNMPNKF